jgi:hypothetical protein
MYDASTFDASNSTLGQMTLCPKPATRPGLATDPLPTPMIGHDSRCPMVCWALIVRWSGGRTGGHWGFVRLSHFGGTKAERGGQRATSTPIEEEILPLPAPWLSRGLQKALVRAGWQAQTLDVDQILCRPPPPGMLVVALAKEIREASPSCRSEPSSSSRGRAINEGCRPRGQRKGLPT